MAPLDLFDAADELLGAAATALATTSGGSPGSRYVSAGQPVYDCCDLLTVHMQESNELSMREAGRQEMPRLLPAVPMVTLVVTSLRCYPIVEGGVTIGVPAAEAMHKASRLIYEDGWTLLNYLRALARADGLFADRPCRPLVIGPLRPAPTQGGCGGSIVLVQVEVDGYAPV